jgi:hypothetical protein
LRLQQHAAQEAVDGADIERLQRRRHGVEQGLQPLEIGVGERRGG